MPELPAELPPLIGVRDQLVQVFVNLVLNAIDAVSETRGGHVELAVRQLADGLVEVTVHDDGSGIAPDDAARLFQPYFTTKKHGTGLGLFVTRKLVTDHGGSVEFDSTPGVGTTFRVRLPLCPGPVGAAFQTIPQRANEEQVKPVAPRPSGEVSREEAAW
jgi:signal transduction histidine kinase